MRINSAFKGLKIVKNPGNGRLNNLNDPNRPQCVKKIIVSKMIVSKETILTQGYELPPNAFQLYGVSIRCGVPYN